MTLGILSLIILEDVLQGARWGGYWWEDACDVGAVECDSHITWGRGWVGTLMGLPIRYTHIPFYFHFSITSSISSIHHYAPPALMRSRSHSLIWWTYDLRFTCFTSILSIPNRHPPTVWPIMSPCTMRSGTYYSFTSDEPYACFLVYHLYLTCLYFTFCSDHKEESQPIAYTSFPQDWELALTPHITSLSPCTILHCITLPHNPTVFTLHHTWRQSLTPRSHPQSPIGFILRSLAP